MITIPPSISAAYQARLRDSNQDENKKE